MRRARARRRHAALDFGRAKWSARLRPRPLRLILAIGFGIAGIGTTGLSWAQTYPCRFRKLHPPA
jgi:hypothetical protein